MMLHIQLGILIEEQYKATISLSNALIKVYLKKLEVHFRMELLDSNFLLIH